MEYKHIEPCNDLDTLYKEIRQNFIMANNKFCEEKYGVEEWVFLCDLFEEPSVDMSSFETLALMFEGFAEACEDLSEEEHFRELKEFSYKLEEKMRKLP